jgi:pyruvate/2-oxoacid:ferredoxin oxidoreductase alpha subunit
MAEKLLMKGNEVIAEAALRAGCRYYFGYPITPQTSFQSESKYRSCTDWRGSDGASLDQ